MQPVKNAQAWGLLWSMEQTALKKIFAAATAQSGEGVRSAGVPSSPQPIQQTPPLYEITGNAAVIPIVGPLTKYPNFLDSICGWCFTLDVQAAVAKALDDGAVEKIILYIDSPGGMVAGTPDLAAFIAAAKIKKPIVAYISDLCASGAYWLASQCSWIAASPSAFIGSIGVYSVLVDQSKAAEQVGVQLTLVSDGEFKGINEPGLPVGDKAVEETQRIVGAVANLFRAAVSQGRNLDMADVINVADGRVHVAAEAMALGLIDEVGTMDAAIEIEIKVGEKISMAVAKTNIKMAADGTDGASGGESSAPDLAEVCGKILDAVNALSEKMDKHLADDDSSADDEKKGDEGGPDDASAKALGNDRDRLKAIMAACPGREKFAMEQFIAGKSAVEAQAALAGVLTAENADLQKKIAAGEEGAEPIRGVQPQGAGAKGDPESVWAKDTGGVQKAFNGNKQYFLAACKHTPEMVAKYLGKAA